ncbi:vgrg protein, partial [Clostridium sporogenes]|nr:vgrg protein [Clostridium sporogenes]
MVENTNLLNSIFLNQYKTQMNNTNKTNTVDGKTLGNFDQQQGIQQMVFQAVLSQMMNSMSGMGNMNGMNSMSGMNGMGSLVATEALLSSLTNTGSFSLGNSLNALSNFNSTMRGAASFLSKGHNNTMDNSFSNLGIRASKYESNLNPAEISDDPGDYGGKSYGAWQFSSRTGSLDSFINSLKGNNNDMYYKLTYAKSKDNGTFGENF